MIDYLAASFTWRQRLSRLLQAVDEYTSTPLVSYSSELIACWTPTIFKVKSLFPALSLVHFLVLQSSLDSAVYTVNESIISFETSVFFLAVPYLAVSVISHVCYYKCFEIKLSHISSQILQGNNMISRLRPCQCFCFFFGLLVCFYHIVLGSNQTNNYALVLFAGLNKNLWAGGKKCDLLFLPLQPASFVVLW